MLHMHILFWMFKGAAKASSQKRDTDKKMRGPLVAASPIEARFPEMRSRMHSPEKVDQRWGIGKGETSDQG